MTDITVTPVRKRRAKSEATAPAAERSTRAQGQRTRTAIIRAARKLLLEGGSLEFSLREVAARAGISISNLQYYFPSRLAVLRAVIEPVIDVYLRDLQRALAGDTAPRDTIIALLGQGLKDSRSTDTAALLWHFISLAAIDDECSRLLDDWYEALTRGVAKLVRAQNPNITQADSLHRATLMIAMVDGLSLQLGAGRRKRDYTRGLETKFLAMVDCLLRLDAPRAPQD